MIIQFTVENFLSFKDAATLSLAASALKEKQTSAEEIIFELTGTNLSLLKSAVVYGANASGKSNLVKALDFFKWFVINSSKGVQSGERIRQVESFRLNRNTENEPSYFEAVFADEHAQYRYGFEVDEKRVYREWLYQKSNKKKAKEVELFLRDKDEYELHPKFAVGKEVVSKRWCATTHCYSLSLHNSTMPSRWKSWIGWPIRPSFWAAAMSGYGKWRSCKSTTPR